jgi:hypothetical protein
MTPASAARLAVAAVTMGAEIGRPWPSKQVEVRSWNAMLTRGENKVTQREKQRVPVSSLQARNRSSMRYHCCNCRGATRTRGVRLALRSASSPQQATKRLGQCRYREMDCGG